MAHQLHAGDVPKAPLPPGEEVAMVYPPRQHHPLALGGPVTEGLETARQQALLQVGHRQVLIHPAHLTLQAIEGETPDHLLLAQAGDAGTAGHRLLQRQLQVTLAKVQGAGLGGL